MCTFSVKFLVDIGYVLEVQDMKQDIFIKKVMRQIMTSLETKKHFQTTCASLLFRQFEMIKKKCCRSLEIRLEKTQNVFQKTETYPY